ncbi:MAG: hypothetical protein WED07_11135 [Candidatus Freyarchaeum deiterrae]
MEERRLTIENIFIFGSLLYKIVEITSDFLEKGVEEITANSKNA